MPAKVGEGVADVNGHLLFRLGMILSYRQTSVIAVREMDFRLSANEIMPFKLAQTLSYYHPIYQR